VNATIKKFEDEIYSDAERNRVRELKRREAHMLNVRVKITAYAILAAVGIVLVMWQVSHEQPTYLWVYIGMALMLPFTAALVGRLLRPSGWHR